MEVITIILNGFVLPFLIIFCGIILSYKISIIKILSPKKFIRNLSEASCDHTTTPFKSMCTALAGTLGVGNIAGVATAIISGGAGAVFWMWIGAIVSMSVKYGEVALAVKYRSYDNNKGFIGGSMYTMKNALNNKLGKRNATIIGGVFSALCIANSFVMGNIIQSNAAASVFSDKSEAIGLMLSTGLLITALLGFKRITSITSYLIPPLSITYIILSLSIILKNYYLLPRLFLNIIECAFSLKAVTGGIYGYGIREAIRFGITRGIFSNEAGCGTSPSAHAAANVKSPHHQGCFGIFEVIADTLILCSMTAFVILIADQKFSLSLKESGVAVTLQAFEYLIGRGAYYIIGVSVILFAFATLIAQLYYGDVAIGYFSKSKIPRIFFVIISILFCFCGATMKESRIWMYADLIIGIMTVVNTVMLIVLRNQIKDIAKFN